MKYKIIGSVVVIVILLVVYVIAHHGNNTDSFNDGQETSQQ
jgi:hypothetical protein